MSLFQLTHYLLQRILSFVKKTIPVTTQRSAFFSLLRAHEKLNAEFLALFKEHGLSQAQFNVLRILVQGPKSGVSCQEISDGLITRVPDVTRLIDRMAAEELVVRSRCPEDRRVVYTRVTPKGRRLCESLYEPVTALHAAQFAHMPKKAVRELNDRLLELLDQS